MTRLLLASGSATRRLMLEAAGVKFEVVRPEANEGAIKLLLQAAGTLAAEIAGRLAASKALSIAAPRGALVLGSDQTLEQDDGTMLDKPRSREEAHTQLASLSGRTHSLHAAAVLTENGQVRWSETLTVGMHMRPLSDDFIERYLDAEYEAVRHNVGCYRIEGMGAQLFERVAGSHFAVLGLPLLPLLAELRHRGVLES